MYDDIRKLLSEQQFAKINGFTPSFFSFNQEGGRCPECQGDGFVKIGMQFMADVTMVCESCGGKRFKPEILEVRYKDKNVDDILNMSVEEAIAFFSAQKEDLAKAIPRKDRILFMFDEPTTGLHFYDVEKLLKAFDALLSRGHSVIVVEHNLDVIRSADWVIDLGPDAGDKGGEVVFAGTPEDLAAKGNTFTAQYLK